MIDGPILVTGGIGFIGSSLVRHLRRAGVPVVVFDAMTYAANPLTAVDFEADSDCRVVVGRIEDRAFVASLLEEVRPIAIVNLAAESHVDRSIDGPSSSMYSNSIGVFEMLEAVRAGRAKLANDFRFIQVSTDEVYGSISDGQFTEDSPYAPKSPYSASKAGGDHIASAYFHTYGMPTIVTNCSNNYGPFQFPEKLIPLSILNALDGNPIAVYGDGQQMHDWIHVDDHVDALIRVIGAGRPGETYLIGADNCLPNLEIVHALCRELDEVRPKADGTTYLDQIRFVDDRPGHDRRYAINATKIRKELDWQPMIKIEEGLKQTVRWYLDSQDWWHPLCNKLYGGDRLGLQENVSAMSHQSTRR